jgi:hypothetical protein
VGALAWWGWMVVLLLREGCVTTAPPGLPCVAGAHLYFGPSSSSCCWGFGRGFGALNGLASFFAPPAPPPAARCAPPPPPVQSGRGVLSSALKSAFDSGVEPFQGSDIAARSPRPRWWMVHPVGDLWRECCVCRGVKSRSKRIN